MASKTAQAIQRAAIEQARDEQIQQMNAAIQNLSAQFETLAQQMTQLVKLLSDATTDAPRKGKST